MTRRSWPGMSRRDNIVDNGVESIQLNDSCPLHSFRRPMGYLNASLCNVKPIRLASKMLRCVKLPLGVPRDHAGRGGTNIELAGPDWSTIGSGPNPNTAPQRRTIARAETRVASLRLVGLGLAWAAAAPSHLLPP